MSTHTGVCSFDTSSTGLLELDLGKRVFKFCCGSQWLVCYDSVVIVYFTITSACTDRVKGLNFKTNIHKAKNSLKPVCTASDGDD